VNTYQTINPEISLC